MISKFFPAALLLLSFTTILSAQSVVQSQNFSASAYLDTPGYNQIIVPSTLLDATFQPFDSSLGTLESFTIAWTLAVTWDYVVGDGGNHSVGISGTLFLNDTGYSGTGGGNGHSLPGSGSLSIDRTPSSTFGPADATLWSLVTGASAFDARFTTPVEVTILGDASVDLTLASTATLTYAYTATAVPEPGTFALLSGLVALVPVCFRRRRRDTTA